MSLKSEEPSIPPISPKHYSSNLVNHSGIPASHHVNISNIPGSLMTISSSQTFIPGKPSNPSYIPGAPVNQAFVPGISNNLAFIPNSSTNLVYSTRLIQPPYSQTPSFQDRPPVSQPAKPAGQHSPQKNKAAPSNVSSENVTVSLLEKGDGIHLLVSGALPQCLRLRKFYFAKNWRQGTIYKKMS